MRVTVTAANLTGCEQGAELEVDDVDAEFLVLIGAAEIAGPRSRPEPEPEPDLEEAE